MALGAFTATAKKSYGAFGGQIVECDLAVTGDYAAGGLICNLNGVVKGTKLPIFVDLNGKSGFFYEWVNGTDLSNGKVQIRVNTGAGVNANFPEHTAVPLVAGVTGDVIKGIFFFPGNIS